MSANRDLAQGKIGGQLKQENQERNGEGKARKLGRVAEWVEQEGPEGT